MEEPAVYEAAWADFMKHLEKVTGKKTKYFGLQNYAAQIEAMRSGRLHISAYSTGSLVYAVHLAGAVPFAIMRDAKGPAGYHLVIITQAKNDKINSVADLKGKRVAHVSQTSNSGHQAPVYFFSRMGVVPGKDYQIAFSGKHDNSALGVVNGDYDAAAVADTVVERMASRGVIKASDYKVIYTSPVFPTAGFAYSHNLEPRLAEKIREAFMTFKIEGSRPRQGVQGAHRLHARELPEGLGRRGRHPPGQRRRVHEGLARVQEAPAARQRVARRGARGRGTREDLPHRRPRAARRVVHGRGT